MKNGWLEVTVLGAVLLGAALGGALVSPAWLHTVAGGPWSHTAMAGELVPALLLLLGVYGLSAGLTLGVPYSGARHAHGCVHPLALCRSPWAAAPLLLAGGAIGGLMVVDRRRNAPRSGDGARPQGGRHRLL